MKIINTNFEEVVIIEPHSMVDERGFFSEVYNGKLFSQSGIAIEFVQDNHSYSAQPGTLRGLHYQLEPMAQTKLVRVPVGVIFDVVVDIRPDSNTFGKWISVILSDSNHRQLLVPKGFAHGFCTLTPNTHVMYKVDQYYSKEHDRGILWSDPELAIDWPMKDVILSEKDQKHPLLHTLRDDHA